MDKFLLLFILNCIILGTSDSYAYQSRLLAQSDTLTIQSWTVDDGLPVNTVNSMAQDDIGYIWFSTYDGLVRFDGVEFEVFNHVNTPVFPHNRLTNVYFQDGVGLWINLEYDGLLLYQNESFQYFGLENGFADANVSKVLELSDKRILFITSKGLFEYTDGRFHQAYDYEPLVNEYINDVFEDNDGSIWISTNKNLVKAESDGTFKSYFDDYEGVNKIWASLRVSDGSFYAATNQGVYKWTGTKFVRDDKLKELNNVTVRYLYEADAYLLIASEIGLYSYRDEKLNKLAVGKNSSRGNFYVSREDNSGKYWLIAQDGRLIMFNEGNVTTLNTIEGLVDMSFNNFYEDRELNKWLLTTQDGLIRLDESKVRTIGVEEGLSGSNILALFESTNGPLWVGTRGNGLNKIERGMITHFNEDNGLNASTIQSIIEDDQNNIWIGYSYKGLASIRGNKITNYEIGSNIESNDVRALFIDKNGQLWIGTYQGLVKYNRESLKYKRYEKEAGLKGLKIRYITEDQQGALWIGTLDGGVSKFLDEEFTNYGTEDGLSSNNIRSIYVDELDAGTIWIGTENNGLNRYKEGAFTYVNLEDGLPDYNIHWVSQDEFGWLWMSSNKGVFKILKAELNDYLDGVRPDFQLISFGSKDGMRNPEGNGSFQEAGLRSKDGKFYFATQEGVAIFNSDESSYENYAPPVIIKKLIVGNESFEGDTVNLAPKANIFKINFQALSFANNSDVRYRYRFYNRDTTWVNIGNDREVIFSDLATGEYHFQVQASNSKKGWNPNSASMVFVVNGRFYQQYWFYVLVLVILVLVYYLIVKLRYKLLLNRQVKLEKTINEQTEVIRLEKIEVENQKKIIEVQAADLRESNRTKDTFFSIIAHDLRNPFQAMVGYSDMLLFDHKRISEEELQERLEMINLSSIKLLGLTNNLLSWASLQTGRMVPEPEEIQLNSILEKNASLFEQSAIQKNIKLKVQNNEDAIIYADPDMIDTVVRNLISNALKFTPSGRIIKLSLRVVGRKVLLKVKDNGIGMNEHTLANLFNIEKITSRTGTADEQGSGLGLLLCQEMVKKNNGTLTVNSKIGEGTTVGIEFSIYKKDIE